MHIAQIITGAPDSGSTKREAEPSLLTTTLCIWGATLLILALPVLAVLAFQIVSRI